MFDYARSDTHFLLYIYDCMRNELIQRPTNEADLIGTVLFNSKETSLKTYDTKVYDVIFAVNTHEGI